MQCLVEKLQHQIVDLTVACQKKLIRFYLSPVDLFLLFKALKIACHFKINKNFNCQVVF